MKVKVCVTIPSNLYILMEAFRKKIKMTRSKFIEKAINNFLGPTYDIKELKKWKKVYKALEKDDIITSREMMKIVNKTLPKK